MARIVSFVVLVAILLVIAGLFFRVMANFLLPMFLAVLLAIMFRPVHRWFIVKCRGRDRVAAGLTTASIILIILVPLMLILLKAAFEGHEIYQAMVNAQGQEDPSPPAAADQPAPEQAAAVDGAPGEARQPAGDEAGPPAGDDADRPEDRAEPAGGVMGLKRWAARECVRVGGRVGLPLRVEDVERAISQKLEEWLTPLALSTTQYVGRILIGLFVMIVSLYYFLADGPAMIRTVMRLSPLDNKYEEELADRFEDVTRAVVVATLLSAFVQGLLAGVGFYFAGLQSVFLLMVLAMLFAMVPFVGAAAVWVPVCLWLFYDGRTTAAALLAVYCLAIVSMADNVIKPVVLHGRSHLHPLLALLSVLGGVQALGPIGIFVGPMVVAFLQTLLNMLHTELESLGNGLEAEPQP